MVEYSVESFASKKSKMSMWEQKCPCSRGPPLFGQFSSLNLDRPAEREARASNKTLGAPSVSICPTWVYASLFIAPWWVSDSLKQAHPRGAGGGSIVVQFWRAGSSSQQTLFFILQSSMTPVLTVRLLSQFKTVFWKHHPSTPILHSSTTGVQLW